MCLTKLIKWQTRGTRTTTQLIEPTSILMKDLRPFCSQESWLAPPFPRIDKPILEQLKISLGLTSGHGLPNLSAIASLSLSLKTMSVILCLWLEVIRRLLTMSHQTLLQMNFSIRTIEARPWRLLKDLILRRDLGQISDQTHKISSLISLWTWEESTWRKEKSTWPTSPRYKWEMEIKQPRSTTLLECKVWCLAQSLLPLRSQNIFNKMTIVDLDLLSLRTRCKTFIILEKVKDLRWEKESLINLNVSSLLVTKIFCNSLHVWTRLCLFREKAHIKNMSAKLAIKLIYKTRL